MHQHVHLHELGRHGDERDHLAVLGRRRAGRRVAAEDPALDRAEHESHGAALADGTVDQLVADVAVGPDAAHLGARRRAEGAHDQRGLVRRGRRLDGHEVPRPGLALGTQAV
ncbi:MAG: hypothetical protein ACK559_19650, partial [bacterium]